MKVLGFLFAVLFLVLMATPALAAPKTAAECDRAGGKCRFLRCPTNLTAIGKCDKKGGVCCKKPDTYNSYRGLAS
nr:beta-defensin C7-like [Pogona vitticeps]